MGIFSNKASKAIFVSARARGVFSAVRHDEELPLLLQPPTRLLPDFSPVNVMFCGRRKKGKTLSMVGVAKRYKMLFHRLRLGWRIQSNHFIEFADYNDPYLLDDIWNKNPLMARKSVICIDEITAAANIRRPMSTANVNSGQFFVQVRKLPCEVMMTTQFPTQVDSTITPQTDIFVLCDAHIHPYARYQPALAARAYVDMYVFDLWGQFTGRYDIRGLGWPPPIWRADKVIRLGNLPAFWNQYKSQELIPTLWGSAAMRERVLSDEWEWDKKVEADTSQAQREGTVPPIDEVLSVSPTTLADFFALRASGGRFRVDKGMTKKAQEFNPAIRTMDDLRRELDVLGYDTERQGQTVIAHVRP